MSTKVNRKLKIAAIVVVLAVGVLVGLALAFPYVTSAMGAPFYFGGRVMAVEGPCTTPIAGLCNAGACASGQIAVSFAPFGGMIGPASNVCLMPGTGVPPALGSWILGWGTAYNAIAQYGVGL